MRTRLSRSERRADILLKASQLFAERGFSGTEMEDIRCACGISRGGLYHHFANKRAILGALVDLEVGELAEALKEVDCSPFGALFQLGSSHLGSTAGVLSAMQTHEEKLDYLSALEHAHTTILQDALASSIGASVREDINPAHVTELFLTINTHINRREILGQWSGTEAAGFAATCLETLAPLLKSPEDLDPILPALKQRMRG